MAEQKNLAQAQSVFRTLCSAFETNEWNYKKDEEKLEIECGAQGDDLPMELTIKVDAERMLVMFISHLPFVIQEDKRLDAAIAVSAINNLLVDGCFDYDVKSGHMFFRMTNSFMDSIIGEKVFSYMLLVSCKIIDEYNDKFLMISKGIISIEQFLTSLNQ